jgi:hypothetical protein
MKIIIQIYIFIIAFLAPISTYASEHNAKLDAFVEMRSVMCVVNGSQLMSNLYENYGETVFALSDGTSVDIKGRGVTVQLIYLRNAITKSYTIIEIYPSAKGCIIAAGGNFDFLNMVDQKPKVPESKI